MRQGSNPRRLRGRGNGRKNPNPRSQTFESNGPEVKVRGNAQQVVEKYLALARDATSIGDRVVAENYFQHAEHYFRIMNANGGGYEQRDNQPQPQPAPNHIAQSEQPVLDAAPDSGAEAASTNGARTAPAKTKIAIDEQPKPCAPSGDGSEPAPA